jgi:hypothetical protein
MKWLTAKSERPAETADEIQPGKPAHYLISAQSQILAVCCANAVFSGTKLLYCR